MSADPRPTTLLRTLRGAPLSCIMAMLLFPDRSLTATALATFTGYDRGTIAAALALLSELTLAQNHGRRTGWLLTTNARQLFLPDATNAGNFPALGGSSSGGLILTDPDLKQLLPPQNPTSGENFPTIEADSTEDLVAWLRDYIGCPDRLARLAAEAARQRGDYETYTRYQALRWLAYTESRDGRSLTFRHAFIARQLERGHPCPESFHDYGERAHEIAKAERAWYAESDADRKE